MPEITIVHLGLLALMLVCGSLIGWIIRGDRCAKEKIAVSAGWQDQLEAQQSEHDRLAGQNQSLMEQISQYQAAQKDQSHRSRELSDSLREAFARRDELQRQLKDARGNFEVAVAQRNRLQETLEAKNAASQSIAARSKDDKIFRLSRELTSWQNRLPPLVERYMIRDREAAAAEAELNELRARLQDDQAKDIDIERLGERVRELEGAEQEMQRLRARLLVLEERGDSDETRIEPVDAGSLPDGGDASNEPNALTAEHDVLDFDDQIDQLDGSDEFLPAPLNDYANSSNGTRDLADIDADETIAAVFGDLDEAALAPTDTMRIERLPENANGCDDLKKIKGIGPSIEQTLNDLGIYYYHQLAVMTESEIDQVAQQLKGFRSRIYREDWIGQARDLEYLKNNDTT